MFVYLVRHHTGVGYIATNGDRPRLTNLINGAFRFGTPEMADKCRQRLQIPVAWEVVQVEFDSAKGVIKEWGEEFRVGMPNLKGAS